MTDDPVGDGTSADSDGTDPRDPAHDDAATAPSSGRALVRALTSVIFVALVVVSVAAGFFWGNRSGSGSSATPTSTSVDAGFARDMSVHHRQAITMAERVLAASTDPAVRLVAFDIDSSQSVQLGEMQGWLESWDLSPVASTRMVWMGHDLSGTALMPGMATPAQMTRLQAASGTSLSVLFLQLMIRHHLGGVAMANYAAQHATQPYVQSLAVKMATLQTSEITQMEQLLRARGGTPLPPPVG